MPSTAGPEAAAAAAVGLFPAGPPPEPEATQSSKRNAVPGTQVMPSMANPPTSPGDAPPGATPASAAAGPAASKRQERTQLLGAIPAPARSRARRSRSCSRRVRRASVGPAVAPQRASRRQQPQPPHRRRRNRRNPSHAAGASTPPRRPTPRPPQPPQKPYAGGAYAPHSPAPHATQPPLQPPQPPPPPAPAGYGFGYVPGSRVTVTWSNGQRYPGTVQQVSGSQCLVVFPDGQHHWVEMQYVAPA